MGQALVSLMTSIHGDRVRHSTYLSTRHKYLYVDTPKAACTTLKQLIADIEGIPDSRFRESLALDSKISMLIHDRLLFNLPSLSDVVPELAEEALQSQSFFRFCFVRNPFSRLFSAWQSKILLHEPYFLVNFKDARLPEFSRAESWQAVRQSFQRFVYYVYETDYPKFSDAHWAAQCNLVFSGKIKYDLVGRTESFAADIRPFFAHLKRHGVPAGTLSPQYSNPGIFRDWRWFYDQDTAALVRTMYDDDFREFNYGRDIDGATADSALPRDADDPRIGNWVDEIIARNEMIVFLRSRLVDQINATAQLKRDFATLQSERTSLPIAARETDAAPPIQLASTGQIVPNDPHVAKSTGFWSRIARHLGARA